LSHQDEDPDAKKPKSVGLLFFIIGTSKGYNPYKRTVDYWTSAVDYFIVSNHVITPWIRTLEADKTLEVILKISLPPLGQLRLVRGEPPM